MRVPGVVSVNLLSAHVARVDDVMSAWIRSGHGECADVGVEECRPGSYLSQAPRYLLLPCPYTLSRIVLARYPVSLYNYIQ